MAFNYYNPDYNSDDPFGQGASTPVQPGPSWPTAPGSTPSPIDPNNPGLGNVYTAPPAQTPMPPVPVGNQGAGTQGDLMSRIQAALKAAGSTDDPNYWYSKISADPNGAGSAWGYWAGRIAQGDGSAGVQNGTVQKFNDGGGGGGLPPGSIGSLLTPFNGTPPSYTNAAGAAGGLPPGPNFPTLPSFQAPTADEAAQFPGYQFAEQQGQKALENSAAARGVTNTGGTLKDIFNYGSNAATQNYQNVFNNDLGIYNTNLQSQYLAPYQAAFNNWNTVLPASQTAANSQNTFNWNQYLNNYDQYRNQKLDTYNMLSGTANTGLTAQ